MKKIHPIGRTENLFLVKIGNYFQGYFNRLEARVAFDRAINLAQVEFGSEDHKLALLTNDIGNTCNTNANDITFADPVVSIRKLKMATE